jgi:hypothetical protein
MKMDLPDDRLVPIDLPVSGSELYPARQAPRLRQIRLFGASALCRLSAYTSMALHATVALSSVPSG